MLEGAQWGKGKFTMGEGGKLIVLGVFLARLSTVGDGSAAVLSETRYMPRARVSPTLRPT